MVEILTIASTDPISRLYRATCVKNVLVLMISYCLRFIVKQKSVTQANSDWILPYFKYKRESTLQKWHTWQSKLDNDRGEMMINMW